VTKHFTVWTLCLVLFDRAWSCLIKCEGHQTFDQKLNISFVLVFDGRCFVRLDSRVSNMFDAGMRTTLAQRLVSVVSSVFDQTWPLTSTLACLVTKQCLMVFGGQTFPAGLTRS